MNEEQIKKLIDSTYEYCQKELEKQVEIMKDVTFDHPDFRIESHMMGYHKGRMALIENLKFCIQ